MPENSLSASKGRRGSVRHVSFFRSLSSETGNDGDADDVTRRRSTLWRRHSYAAQSATSHRSQAERKWKEQAVRNFLAWFQEQLHGATRRRAGSGGARSQQFLESLAKMKERLAEVDVDKEPIPVFNKRLYVAHGNVVLTSEARRVMERHARRPALSLLGKAELQAMRCVVDGLRLIHRGQDHVKDALSHAVTFESYPPFQYIEKRPQEAQLSCYYILHGAVQVTYDMDQQETRNVFQPDIIYNHGTGEFFGLVSPDGLSDDLTPPATVHTTEHSEFLRIDRQRFHAMIDLIEHSHRQEKLSFFEKPVNPLCSVPVEALEKVIVHVHKMEYPPGRTILHQDEQSDYMYFILSGRCKLSREVFIPEICRDVTFHLDSREQDDFFGEECILNEDKGSEVTVTTTSHTSCFLMHRSALHVVSKETLMHVLEDRRHGFPPDDELRERGYRKFVWDDYKHHEVRMSLHERGCLHFLSRDEPEKVRSRPPTSEYQKRENLFRFMAKGASYTPVVSRARSATQRPREGSTVTVRPRTALGVTSHQARSGVSRAGHESQPPARSGVRVEAVGADNRAEGPGDEPLPGQLGETDDVDDALSSTDDDTSSSASAGDDTQITASFVRMLEKNMPRGVLQKILGHRGVELDPRAVGRAMQDNPEIGRQLRLAWEMQQQERKDGFTKTSVLVTMRTDDIVRKAKAVAEKHNFASKEESCRDEGDDSGRWDTSLHKENNNARVSIAGDKFRAAFLRRQIHLLQRKRAKERLQRTYRSARPGQVPSKASQVVEKFRLTKDAFSEREQAGAVPKCDTAVSASQSKTADLHMQIRSTQTTLSNENNESQDTRGSHLKHSSGASSTPEDNITTRFTRKQQRLKDEGDPSGKGSLQQHELTSEICRKPMSEQKPVSVQQDAPVTLRTFTTAHQTLSTSQGVSKHSAHKKVILKGSAGERNLPYPKLQINRN